ncbi:P-loop containing nucleoside triphosphate hydrolase protein [Aspergillus aurantiobrunneus]
MLVAFRRSAGSLALRSSPRTLSARSTPLRLQSLYSSVSGPSYVSKSLYHFPSRQFSSQANPAQNLNAAEENGTEQVEQKQPELPTLFQELAERNLVSGTLIDTLTRSMRLERMTDVQRMTITESVKGGDVLAQAKTGTGKTIAFLLPVMERLLSDPSIQRSTDRRRGRGRGRGPATDIRTIIISPTRELAEQIAVEARRVAAGSGLIVQTAVGGTQKRLGLQRIRHEGCHILVGTPGRLNDILSDPTSGVAAPKLSAFVLDEADRLLDDGFAPELMQIQQLLPDPSTVDRQTLMFSATVPREVMGMVRQTMKPDFRFVKTVSDEEVPTHLSVPQKAAVLQGLENGLPALLELVKSKLGSGAPFKAIVYFNSTKQANNAYEVFDQLLNDPENPRSGNPLGRLFLADIHSGLSQAQRTRVANSFRACTSGILFSSDVTARGMDFPGVTHVIQVGVPRTREDYIHRLGRTARAGKTGEGWVLVHEAELRAFLFMIGDIPVKVDRDTLSTASIDLTADIEAYPEATAETIQTIQQVKSGMAQIPLRNRQATCTSHLVDLPRSFRNKRLLHEAFQHLAVQGYGLRSTPGMSRKVASVLQFPSSGGVPARQRRDRDWDRLSNRGNHYNDSESSYRRRDSYPLPDRKLFRRDSNPSYNDNRRGDDSPGRDRLDRFLHSTRSDEWA